MKKFLVLLLFSLQWLMAQNIDYDAILRKSDAYKQSQEYDKGIKYLQGILKKNPFIGAFWDELAGFYQRKEQTSNVISISTGDINDKNFLNDLLMQALTRPNYYKMIYTSRCGAACGYGSTWCEILLRNMLVDHPVDTAVSTEAKEYFDKAEKDFGDQNFGKAIENYKKAIEKDSTYYKANLYLGDTYYAMKDYKNAILYFKQGIIAQPNLLEPRKYLVDAYLNADAYEDALDACVKGICVYPDFSMMIKLKDIHEALGHKFNYCKLMRTVLPNGTELDKKSEKQVVIVRPIKNSAWLQYKQGILNFKSISDSKEIIYDQNGKTPLQYQEIEAWKYMLSNSNSNILEDAKKIEQDGYLECYVMIDNFHVDFYNQFKVWIEGNKEKVATYLTTYRIK